MDKQSVSTIIDSVHNGQTDALEREWNAKFRESPQKGVDAARKLLYGVVTPNLAETLPDQPEAIAEVQACFESLFKSIEQTTQTRSRQPARSS